VVVTAGLLGAIRSCKAPVKSSPPTNQQPVFLQARCAQHIYYTEREKSVERCDDIRGYVLITSRTGIEAVATASGENHDVPSQNAKDRRRFHS